MGPLVGATELSKALAEAANNLVKPHSSTDATLTLLDEIESLLATVEQDPTAPVQNALFPLMKAMVSADLLRNPDSDVRVSVVSCLTEIMRITAPEAPYNDDQMKDIFQVTIEAFDKLVDASSRSYRKAEVVLETVAKVRSSLVMLDLECDDLVLEMFRQFLKIIRPDHPLLVLLSMETIMITVIDESEEVPMDLLEILLTSVKKESQNVSPAASTLVEKVLSSCACKLQPCIMEALKSTGASLDMYSPVVSSICQNESAITQGHSDVKAKENEADEKISEEHVIPSDSLEVKLNLGISLKGNRSKRTARGGTRQANIDEKVPTENEGQSESTDAETASGSKRKRGRKPNSLMNAEEGYSFKTSSSKKVQEKELEDPSLAKVAAKKATSPTKVGQTNQSVAKTGSSKRSRTKMEETNHDVGSSALPPSKKQIVKKDNREEEDLMESDLEKPEDGVKTGRSSKKEKTQNGLAKTSAKKPLADTKNVKPSGKKSDHLDAKKETKESASMKKLVHSDAKKKTSGGASMKKLVHSDAKKKNSAGASENTPIPRSSKSKKKDSLAMTPSTKKSEQTPKNHPKRKRTAGEDMESNTNDLSEGLVGKKVSVWWPLDKAFYEGVIDSYSSIKKMHKVTYLDGDEEELNLKNERYKIIQQESDDESKQESDDETIPLSELIIQKQKAKKSKNVSKNVEPISSPELGSSMQTTKMKDSVGDSGKQAKRTKGALSNKSESTEGKNRKSLEGLNGDPVKTKSRTGKKQKVTRAMHPESEKDCDDKEDLKTKGEACLTLGKESEAEPIAMEGHQQLPENQNAETKTEGEEEKSAKEPNEETDTDGKECNSLREPNEDPKTDGEEQEAGKEPTGETKIDEEEEHKVAKDTNLEIETDGEEKESLKETHVEPTTEGEERMSVKESLKETHVEPTTEGEERMSVKEPNAEPETKVQEKEESGKDQTTGRKLIEKEDMSEAKEEEVDKETETSMPETGKVENEAEEDDQRVIKELEAVSDKGEVSTTVLQVDL
ncbi:titin homolog isoform X1 [Capsella rubella]|uniref:titin homolog isoform X1 n=1 Tax=Capsella rubella TaxID=81985 RepID=UPI000CD53D56|nr:titin homolog isoform X1 [Capsella rubella]